MPAFTCSPLRFTASLLTFLAAGQFISCTEKKEEKNSATEKPVAVVVKNDKQTPREELKKEQTPVINITDTIAVKYNLLCIKDSALNSVRLSEKLAQIYGVRLAEAIKKNKLKAVGPPHAWYKTQKAPFFFEAGIPVDKKPAKLDKKMSYKQIGGDSAVVAHYYGPYEQTHIAYEALQEFLKDRRKKSIAPAYEVYIGDPIDAQGKAVDPYKVLTDIVFPHN
jgi:effector-binding domain-containing protein